LQAVEDFYHLPRRTPIIEWLITGQRDSAKEAILPIENVDVTWVVIALPPDE
jgi:hypothetical protein